MNKWLAEDQGSRLRLVPVGLKHQIAVGGALHADGLDVIAGMEGAGRKIVSLRRKADTTGLVPDYDLQIDRAARSCPEVRVRALPGKSGHRRRCGQVRCEDHWWLWDPARRVDVEA